MKFSHIQTIIGIAFLAAACTPVGKVVRPPVVDVVIDASDWPECSEESEKTDYDEYFLDEEFGKRLQLAGRLSGAIEELEDSAESFEEEQLLIDIFPYLLKLRLIENLRTGMSKGVKNKTTYLSAMLATYDAYSVNRDAFDRKEPDSVDRQWVEYFRQAEKLGDEWTPEEGVDVLLSGINAHILSDMPRALRYVKLKSKLGREEFEPDFRLIDKDFLAAEAKLKKTVLGFFPTGKENESAQKFFGNGYEYVKFSHQKAFEMGFGDGFLGVIEEQPVLNHDWKSTKYFPEKLRKRGVCRFE